MTISTLHLDNFQAHKDTRLDLEPGLNAIVGQSDSGKTAIVRALRWLTTNRPSGDAFRSWWGGETAVSLVLDEDVEVVRRKSKSENAYSCTHESDSAQYTALGSDVPEAISKLLNISELSWQGQMDAPFLLSSSPGEVARTLNEVADLDRIDLALANINRMTRDNRSALMEATRRTTSTELELARYRDLNRWAAALKALQEREARAATLTERADRCEEVLIEIEDAQTVLSQTKDLKPAYEMLDLLTDRAGQMLELERQERDLREMESVLIRTSQTLISQKKALKQIEETWHASFAGKRCPLCGK